MKLTGAGSIEGLGESGQEEDDEEAFKEFEASLEDSFSRIGLDEKQAASAAKGRGGR